MPTTLRHHQDPAERLHRGDRVIINGFEATIVRRVALSADHMDSLYSVRFDGDPLPAKNYYLGTQMKRK